MSVALWSPHLDVRIITDHMPSHWAFYFQGSGLPFIILQSLVRLCLNVDIVLWEVKTVVPMLYGMAFWLTTEMSVTSLCNPDLSVVVVIVVVCRL